MLSPDGGVLLPRARGGRLVALDDVPTPVSVVPDVDRPELYCNDAYFDMIGLERGAASYADVRLGALYHPDDHLEIAAALERIVGGDPYAEMTARLRAGELGWRYHRIAARTHPAAGEVPARLVCSFLDVDDEQRGRADVELAAGRLDLLGSTGDVATFEWADFDPATQAVWSESLSRMLGYEPGELEPTLDRYLEHVHPADVPTLREAVDRVAAGTDRLFDIEYRLRPRGGGDLWVRSFGRVYLSDTGRRNFVGLLLNVDERQRAVRSERDVRTELERFIYSVSHDFTVPVRQLERLAELLAESLDGRLPPAQAELLSHLRAASDRLSRMVEGLLGYSRLLRLGGGDELVQLTEAARDVASIVGRDYPGEIDVESLPEVRGNPTLLHRLLYVLMDNAAKFSARSERPRVRVYARESPDGIGHGVIVEDNGVGFDELYADELFVLFSRLHGPEEFEGLGVGLATAARIVRLYGGRIDGEGRRGGGACFEFHLPGARMPAAAEA